MNHSLEEIEIEEHSEPFVDANSMVNDFETNEEQENSKETLSNRRKSNVWQYFRKTSRGTSTCLLCGASRGHSNGGTSNLWTHLKLAHRDKAELHNISRHLKTF